MDGFTMRSGTSLPRAIPDRKSDRYHRQTTINEVTDAVNDIMSQGGSFPEVTASNVLNIAKQVRSNKISFYSDYIREREIDTNIKHPSLVPWMGKKIDGVLNYHVSSCVNIIYYCNNRESLYFERLMKCKIIIYGECISITLIDCDCVNVELEHSPRAGMYVLRSNDSSIIVKDDLSYLGVDSTVGCDLSSPLKESFILHSFSSRDVIVNDDHLPVNEFTSSSWGVDDNFNHHNQQLTDKHSMPTIQIFKQ